MPWALNIGDLNIRTLDACDVTNDGWVAWRSGNDFKTQGFDEKAASPIKIGYGEACMVGAQYLESALRSRPSFFQSDRVRTLT